MTNKRFVGGEYGFFDRYHDNRLLWCEWKEIIEIMNNLDTKARERSKALSKLQKENNKLKEEIETLNDTIDGLTETIFHYNMNEGRLE